MSPTLYTYSLKGNAPVRLYCGCLDDDLAPGIAAVTLSVDTSLYLSYKNIARGGMGQIAKDSKKFITIVRIDVAPPHELTVFKQLGFRVHEKSRTIAYNKDALVRINAKVARDALFVKGEQQKKKMADEMLFVKYAEYADGSMKKLFSKKMTDHQYNALKLRTFFMKHVASRRA
jgi:hypothetical protein